MIEALEIKVNVQLSNSHEMLTCVVKEGRSLKNHVLSQERQKYVIFGLKSIARWGPQH